MQDEQKSRQALIEEIHSLRTLTAGNGMQEGALQAIAERYRAMIEGIGDGYNEVDPEGNFTFFNESFRRLMGYDREALLGMNYRRCTDRENAEKIFKAYNNVFKTGDPLDRFEWDIIRKDGTRRHIEVSVSLIKDPSGKATGFRSIVRDVTERKIAQRALQESESNYRSIFDNSIMGIYQNTPGGRFIKANPACARILGYDSPEDIVNSIVDIGRQIYTNPEDCTRLIEKLNENGHATFETRIRRKDGTAGWILNNVRLVRDREGEVLYYEGLIQDIADLKRVEKELQETLRELESRVRERTKDLEESNTTLRVLINRRAEDRKHLEERLRMNVNDLILPIIEELKDGMPDKKRSAYLALLESNLKDITSPFLSILHSADRNLTRREIQIAGMIRDGLKKKEISELMGIRPATVDTHRNHIRKKLGLIRGKSNLRSYLLSIR